MNNSSVIRLRRFVLPHRPTVNQHCPVQLPMVKDDEVLKGSSVYNGKRQSPATDGEDYFGSAEKRTSMASQASLEDGTPGIAVLTSSGRSGSGMGALSPFFPTVTTLPASKWSAEMAGVDSDTLVGNDRAIAGRNAIKYEDLVPVAILGIGGFGRVELWLVLSLMVKQKNIYEVIHFIYHQPVYENGIIINQSKYPRS
ncbi:hypothetical protein ACTXT7_002008 [Hymenolepis weldensis]